MVWDLHDSPLNYRHCLCDLTSDPEKADWSAKNFSAVIHHLPGLRDMASELQEVCLQLGIADESQHTPASSRFQKIEVVVCYWNLGPV